MYLILLISALIFSGCTPSPRYASTDIKSKTKKSSKSSKKTANHKKQYIGISSYYGPKFHGKLTANGEIFDMYGVTAAHKKLPFNTYVRVTNENNNKNLLIRINDRGPYVGDRILDCSYGAAKKLGFVNDGTAPVKIEVVEWGDNEYMHHK